MFIDTHVHLNNKTLNAKIEEVLCEASNAKVNKFLVVGYDLESSMLALEIANKYDNCYCALGFHPTEIRGYSDNEYSWLESHLTDDKVVALGEIGYDFYHDDTTKEEQEVAFIRQIELAKKYKLPVVIHSRDALELTYSTLKKYHIEEVGGVMHSYSGSLEMAPLFIKENFYLGVGGPVTFKNAKEIKKVVENIDLK